MSRIIRKLMLLVAIVALVTLTLALPAVANEGSDNAATKWNNADQTGKDSWATIEERDNTRSGWCVSTQRQGEEREVPAVCEAITS